ncbi:hypothetical protein HDV05_001187, partial [Chytridiales sp. JEL 0842]
MPPNQKFGHTAPQVEAVIRKFTGQFLRTPAELEEARRKLSDPRLSKAAIKELRSSTGMEAYANSMEFAEIYWDIDKATADPLFTKDAASHRNRYKDAKFSDIIYHHHVDTAYLVVKAFTDDLLKYYVE